MSDQANKQAGAVEKQRPAPLPTSTEGLLELRKSMHERTLNDHVDDIHVQLWSDPDYHRLLEAVYDEDAVEGSLSVDNYLAAGMIREFAREEKRGVNLHVANKKLATIVKALNIVLRRYGMSRSERARTVGGVVVNPGNAAYGTGHNGNGGE